jgi:predicted methyltransferase
VYSFSFFDQPEAMLKSMNDALKPGGLMLIVDIPSEQVGTQIVGYDAEEVIQRAAAAGFSRVGENGVVPGHYSLIFRKGTP